MSGTDVKTLMIQVDASVELLRRSFTAAEGTLAQFENRTNQTSERVNRAFARMGQGTTASAGQMKAGMQQLSFQLNDVATQFASGTKPMIIFAQQGSQVLQAVQMMSGSSKGLVGFLAGPWGMAITAATVALTPFVAKMLDGTTAAEENAKAMDGVKLASSHLGDVQSVLGEMFDLTTGKIKDQSEALRFNAQVMALKLRDEAAGNRASSERIMASARSGETSRTSFWTHDALTQKKDRAHAAQLAGVVRQVDLWKSSGGKQGMSPSAAAKWSSTFDFTPTRYLQAEFINALSQDLDAFAADKRADNIDAGLQGKLPPSLLKPASKPHGPSTEVLARRAEVARVKMLDEDSAYTSAERQARHALLDATRKTTASEEQRDALLREDINAEAEAAKTRIANDLSAKKLTDEQAAHLTDLAEQTRQQKLLNVDLARRAEIIRDAAAIEVQGYDGQIAILQLQEGMATTVQQRREIQRRLLDLETKRLLAEQQAIIDNPLSSTNDTLDAIGRQQQIRKEQSLKRAGIDRANPMPMEEYAQRLKTNTDDMTEALQRVKADGLQSLEDGLVGAIAGTHSLGDAFKSMANQIIADLARIAVEKMIVNVIGHGLLGFAEGGPVLKKATGGFIAGPGTGTSDSIMARLSNGEYVMRAEAVRRIGVPALDMLNSGRVARFAAGGLVAPRVPRMTAGRAPSDPTAAAVNLTINAPGATAETVAMIRRELVNAAPMIAAASTAQTTRAMSRRRL